MESSTNIHDMLSSSEKIIVPTYQRAYSWETPRDEKDNRSTQTNVFLSDLEEYSNSNSKTKYYFGHFLFEKKGNLFYIIDGQQRLTTIIIFLSAIFEKLKSTRELTIHEKMSYENMIERYGIIKFSTVDYDDQIFVDYIINKTRKNKTNIETQSAKRFISAFDYFRDYLEGKDDQYLTTMLKNISEASCTTHQVSSESEAIQMFIFQNNRGKKPSTLEIIKAQFMYNVHLYAGNNADGIINTIKNRFEKIYKSISSIEYKVNEDDVLVYSLRVYFNSLWESNSTDRINAELSKDDPITFIQNFTEELSNTFEYITTFLARDERDNINIHSLVTLGGISIAFPFIVKSYKFNLDIEEVGRLCVALESLVLRHRLIGTKANIVPRLNDVFASFSDNNINPIIDRITWLKTVNARESQWWAYWNNDELEKSIQGKINHSVARFLLWKYENHLESQGKSGYMPTRYDKITNPELEHIAPTEEPKKTPHGYNKYDDEFVNQYLDCLGNYLLLSKSHNCAVGNIPFPEKYVTYKHTNQQREIQSLLNVDDTWNKSIIQKRKEKIIRFIMNSF